MTGLELYRQNLLSFIKMTGGYGDLLEFPSGSVAAFSGTPYADENWALLTSDADEDEINTVKEFFATYDVPFIAPHNPGTGKVFLKLLDRLGLTVQKHYTAMQIYNARERKLKQMPAPLPAPGTKKEEQKQDSYGDIIKIEGERSFFQWCEAVWRGFSGDGVLTQGYYDFLRYLFHKEENEFFALTMGVEIIGTAMLHKTQLGFGLYYFSVVPEQRCKGNAKRLLEGVIKHADCERQQRLVLLATEEGRGFYEKMDFEIINEIPVRSLSNLSNGTDQNCEEGLAE